MSRPQINDRVALMTEELKHPKTKIGTVKAVYGGRTGGPVIVGVDWKNKDSDEFQQLDFMYSFKLKRVRE